MEQNNKNGTKFYIGAETKRRRLRVSDPDFVPPDGGWGWLIVFTCGFSNLSTFPVLQQFGIIFREKFRTLGISNSEITTIINMNSAATACIGLLNGPVFRKLSFRQYGLIGSATIAISLLFTAFARSFLAYLMLFSIFYGVGLGINQTSNALALNTYFREKRRVATGLSWTTTGLGPIVCPYIITFLMNRYGMESTVSLFAAFAGNAIVCALLLQPVHWHTKFREEDDIKIMVNGKDAKLTESGYNENKLSRSNNSRSLFSSQYFSNEDNRYSAAFDMVDIGTPMMIRANDGYYSRRSSFGSKMSLASSKGVRSRLTSGQNSVAISNRPSFGNLADARKKKQSRSKLMIEEHHDEDCPTEKAPQDLKEEEKALLSKIETPIPIEYPNEKDVLKSAAKKLTRYKARKEIEAQKRQQEREEKRKLELEAEEKRKKELEGETKKLSFVEKLVMFFDLTLLKDYVYVNLMLGLTIANFVELNFSILTPFVLQEFHFENFQIATFMSLLGATDVVCRFFIPFVADRMSWQNKSFFLLGVCCMAFGRIRLLNGPVFRKLSFRQYGLIGSATIAISLLFTAFARSFLAYLMLFSIFYGVGLGINQTSNALALNTYFREKRRVATGLSWTTTGLGPIVCPYIITFLMNRYGMESTVSLFAAFAGNAIVCALLLQPVHWHTKFREEDDIKIMVNGKDAKLTESGYNENKLSRSNNSRSLFSSQYFSNEDNRYSAAFDMVDIGTPMMIRANDGYYSRRSSFGSKMSLASTDARKKKQSRSKLMIEEHHDEDCPTEKAPQDLKEEEKALLSKIETPIPIEYPNEKDVLKSAAKKLTRYKARKEIEAQKRQQEREEKRKLELEAEEKRKKELEGETKKLSFVEKLVMFFDLTLLKDYVYVNLMLGLTIANFVELNFSILTPFVLQEFHFENFQIATFMSLLGATDVLCRFFIPFVADRMSWQNKSFFLLGVCCMAFGRIILVHTQSYSWSILVALIIGFGKGLRTVFIALVIPTHVPLEKLPAASGLHLVTSGIFFLLMGPIIGWIRDFVKDYVITIHILNILTYITAISWLTEKYITSRKNKKKNETTSFIINIYSLGVGLGINQTSNALALNTYFREKRRVATGLSWTTTGLGPIVCPYIITFLMNRYGMESTVSLFAAFAGNAIVCALLLQPVHWHTKFREEDDIKIMVNGKDAKLTESGYNENKLSRNNRYSAAFDMVDIGTPMMIRANDGYYSRRSSFGSKMSLASSKGVRSRLTSGQNSVAISNRPSFGNLADARKKKQSRSKLMIEEHHDEDCPTEKAPQDLKEEEKALLSKIETPIPIEYPNEKDVLKSAAKKLTRYKARKEIEAQKRQQEREEKRKLELEAEEKRKKELEGETKKLSFVEKLVMFFDLTLLKDYVYVNLMLGLTIANFVELNFSILTPFVLQEFHFENFQIATFMSLLGATDVVCRFFIPFVADRMSWQNKSFFLLGVCCMAFGRIILVHTQSYSWSILVALIIGFGKGLRTVFIALVIPTHVPLEKLPAASGLHLVTSGIFFLLMGPIIGWIRDFVKDYVITIHILNILTYITAISWLTEKYITSRKNKKKNETTVLETKV
ncbi:Major Facilitator Superfamily [Popillia japonica]|uniref:Major Facilitator Superfamily n=1 Tax=Popillia japonica TaxID=7064 RepID=A0AAW1N2Q6_POPJA